MKLHHLQGRKKTGYTTFGCVWDKGEVKEPVFRLLDEQGKALPVQSKVLAWWPDKSVKWSAHTADASQMPENVEVVPESMALDKGGFRETSQEDFLQITESEDGWQINTGRLQLTVNKAAGAMKLAEQIKINHKLIAKSIYPVFIIEHRSENGTVKTAETREFGGEIISAKLEEAGPLQAIICFRGHHIPQQETCTERAAGAVMPFVIKMYLWAGSDEIRFQHTFLYDGVEEQDFLKGMGIRFDMCMGDKPYDRHIQFGTDKAHFHEAAILLSSNHPRVGGDILQRQLDGDFVDYEASYGEMRRLQGEEQARKLAASEEEWNRICSNISAAVPELPVWNDYHLYQDSAYHYMVAKKTEDGCCEIPCMHGKRSPGIMAVNSEIGGILLGIRDFWQKYPSGLEVTGLGVSHPAEKWQGCGVESDCAEKGTCCTAWFYSPKAEAFDFRHYSRKSYPRTCYEGFDHVDATAYGIGVTSECRVKFTKGFAGSEELYDFAENVQKPAVYVGEPEYYHDKKAFGYWSLPAAETEVEKWLEQQLDKSFEFYKEEIEGRDWYGLFDYGDVMHTYDSIRHVWKYDMGGMAWQNTELVPTYWLWLYFLRTGREDVFTLMEAMSRHCSEVDVYHFGRMKGLGSRHNVRHWGCSCKEPRIAMAGHHRFLYYLTGDARLRDFFEDVKDSDHTMIEQERRRARIEGREYEPGARSGPDWSTYVSNWMTWYELTLDETYRKKIETGISDLAATPYGLASGPDYGYDVETSHLIYQGEIENTPNQHLQICMGGPQVWWETGELLEDDRMNQMMADLGAFYYLDKEEKARLTGGLIKERPFSWPMFVTGISAYSAVKRNDEALARQSWEILLKDLWVKEGRDGYSAREYARGTDGRIYKEIPWNTTNTAAQWGLNVIMCLEFIREYLPKTMEELEQMME